MAMILPGLGAYEGRISWARPDADLGSLSFRLLPCSLGEIVFSGSALRADGRINAGGDYVVASDRLETVGFPLPGRGSRRPLWRRRSHQAHQLIPQGAVALFHDAQLLVELPILVVHPAQLRFQGAAALRALRDRELPNGNHLRSNHGPKNLGKSVEIWS